MTAGWPAPGAFKSGAIGYSAKLCKPTRTSFPFSTRGLVGGAAGPFGDEVRCLTPKKVLIRVRVVFHEPARLELDSKRQWVGAVARIDKGQIAVRLPSGKPLAYAEVLDSGSARMFAKGCS
jgi:hypothetical protein